MTEGVRSAFDAVAPTYDDHRALPGGVAEAIRTAVRASTRAPAEARVLDLGAGTGRIGLPFVAARDRYVGADASFGMLREFATRAHGLGAPARPACLVHAAGERLPFANATFDVIMLMQVLSGARGWRRMLDEARRVLGPGGSMVVGRTVWSPGGVDARMKEHLARILADLGEPDDGQARRTDPLAVLSAAAARNERVVAASWTAERTPRRYLDRHQTGHRFLQLPEAVQSAALTQLRDWAMATFGSLDAVASDPTTYELQIFTFPS